MLIFQAGIAKPAPCLGAKGSEVFRVCRSSKVTDSVTAKLLVDERRRGADSIIRPFGALLLGNPLIIYEIRGDFGTMPEKRVDDQSNVSPDMLAEAEHILREQLTRLGLKRSSQRDTILRIFLGTRDHLSTEELHSLIKKQDAEIGYTTVYRALKLFTQCGLAAEVEFHDGVARYEHRLNRRNHHHMVCTICGDSVEFFAPEIEEIEHRIGKKFKYVTTQHSFQIYGTCETCRGKPKNNAVHPR